MFPLTRVPFWSRFFEPHPNGMDGILNEHAMSNPPRLLGESIRVRVLPRFGCCRVIHGIHQRHIEEYSQG